MCWGVNIATGCTVSSCDGFTSERMRSGERRAESRCEAPGQRIRFCGARRNAVAGCIGTGEEGFPSEYYSIRQLDGSHFFRLDFMRLDSKDIVLYSTLIQTLLAVPGIPSTFLGHIHRSSGSGVDSRATSETTDAGSGRPDADPRSLPARPGRRGRDVLRRLAVAFSALAHAARRLSCSWAQSYCALRCKGETQNSVTVVLTAVSRRLKHLYGDQPFRFRVPRLSSSVWVHLHFKIFQGGRRDRTVRSLGPFPDTVQTVVRLAIQGA